MKVKMKGTEWKEVGELVGIMSVALSPDVGQGTVFYSKGGVEIFFSTKDMKTLGSAGSDPASNRIFS